MNASRCLAWVLPCPCCVGSLTEDSVTHISFRFVSHALASTVHTAIGSHKELTYHQQTDHHS